MIASSFATTYSSVISLDPTTDPAFLNSVWECLHKVVQDTYELERTSGHLKRLGRLGRVQEQISLVCSAVFEAFGTVWTASAPIQLVKSENTRC